MALAGAAAEAAERSARSGSLAGGAVELATAESSGS